ncbi:MAG TPA: type I phosphomannose isomerase catalytic subunit [Acidobacteriaceae bacterium]
MTMIEPKLEPFRLGIFFSERVWGRHDLAPWYKHPVTEPVGEAWLTGEQCKVETGPYVGKSLAEMQKDFGADLLGDLDEFPLLVKILFPEDKLSVQVHPDDAHAAKLGGDARGKTECWYVLEAAPGATLSLGVKPGTTREMVREALGKESFEALLHEVPVQAGDMIFVEAGTIHAIGPGLVILEVQQMSDSTFRLYDYGRPRELHLEEGMKAVKIENASGKISSRRGHPCSELIHVKYFAVDRCDVAAGESHSVRGEGRPECVVGLSGKGVVTHGETRLDLPVGYAVVIPACCGGYTVEGECGFVRARVPVEAG